METVKVMGTPKVERHESTVEAGLSKELRKPKKVVKKPKRKLTAEEEEARTTATMGYEANPNITYNLEGGEPDTTKKGSAFYKGK